MQLTDVVIHIDNNINNTEQKNLVENLRELEGVIAPRFNNDKKHLLSVAYNSDTITALTLLQQVKEQGYQAQLLGL